MSPTDSNKDKPSVLKNAREAKGLTLEIVHEATKIPMDALRAIEEGYSVRILSPFYYRGFIKIYAEFLGLDIGEIYKQYGLNQAPAPSSSATVSAKSNRKEIQPNVVLDQIEEGLSSVFTPKTFKLVLKIIGALVLFFVLFKMGGCIASHLSKKGTLSPKQSFSWGHERKVNSHKDVDEAKMAAPSQVIKHESVQAQSENHKVEVAVRAAKDTWLRVKADDKVVYETTLSKGSMESWTADSRIELSGRDLEQLDMEVNNKQIGYLGGGERRVRRVLITQEGLTVKK